MIADAGASAANFQPTTQPTTQRTNWVVLDVLRVFWQSPRRCKLLKSRLARRCHGSGSSRTQSDQFACLVGRCSRKPTMWCNRMLYGAQRVEDSRTSHSLGDCYK